MTLPISHYQFVITKLSLLWAYQIVITKLSLPNCRYQIVITKFFYQIDITNLRPSSR